MEQPFFVSTVLLSLLAELVAFLPVVIRLVDRDTKTTIAIVADDEAAAERTSSIMHGVLTGSGGESADNWDFRIETDRGARRAEVGDGRVDGGADRDAGSRHGRLDFTFLTGQGSGPTGPSSWRSGRFAVAFLEWTEVVKPSGGGAVPPADPRPSSPAPDRTRAGAPLGAAEIASRQLLGTVLVVILFLTMVIYGMWVAAGVAAEKETRVMELLISAASPRQLVLGKVLGIGLAGLAPVRDDPGARAGRARAPATDRGGARPRFRGRDRP